VLFAFSVCPKKATMKGPADALFFYSVSILKQLGKGVKFLLYRSKRRRTTRGFFIVPYGIALEGIKMGQASINRSANLAGQTHNGRFNLVLNIHCGSVFMVTPYFTTAC